MRALRSKKQQLHALFHDRDDKDADAYIAAHGGWAEDVIGDVSTDWRHRADSMDATYAEIFPNYEANGDEEDLSDGYPVADDIAYGSGRARTQKRNWPPPDPTGDQVINALFPLARDCELDRECELFYAIGNRAGLTSGEVKAILNTNPHSCAALALGISTEAVKQARHRAAKKLRCYAIALPSEGTQGRPDFSLTSRNLLQEAKAS